MIIPFTVLNQTLFHFDMLDCNHKNIYIAKYFLGSVLYPHTHRVVGKLDYPCPSVCPSVHHRQVGFYLLMELGHMLLSLDI